MKKIAEFGREKTISEIVSEFSRYGISLAVECKGDKIIIYDEGVD